MTTPECDGSPGAHPDPDADASFTAVVRSHQTGVVHRHVLDDTGAVRRTNDGRERVRDRRVPAALAARFAVEVDTLADVLDVVNLEIVGRPEMESRRRSVGSLIDVDVLEQQPGSTVGDEQFLVVPLGNREANVTLAAEPQVRGVEHDVLLGELVGSSRELQERVVVGRRSQLLVTRLRAGRIAAGVLDHVYGSFEPDPPVFRGARRSRKQRG
ncbi:hypothetical protein [Halococcus salifodinae]|uniref:hypothetical protein n=1 Tax=Halococcus salifodinae TaxID=36738 RepID=UPI00126911AD|nr:hypothetical protein [Halococcus salifodinae]